MSKTHWTRCGNGPQGISRTEMSWDRRLSAKPNNCVQLRCRSHQQESCTRGCSDLIVLAQRIKIILHDQVHAFTEFLGKVAHGFGCLHFSGGTFKTICHG